MTPAHASSGLIAHSYWKRDRMLTTLDHVPPPPSPPLQTGRHRPPQGAPHVDKPYGKSAPPRGTARRGGRGGLSNPGRAPSGTPPGISALRQAPSKAEKDHAKSELSRKLSSAEMKAWLENRMIAPGVLDMSVSIIAWQRGTRLIEQ